MQNVTRLNDAYTTTNFLLAARFGRLEDILVCAGGIYDVMVEETGYWYWQVKKYGKQ